MSNLKIAIIENFGNPIVGRYEGGMLKNCYELRIQPFINEITQKEEIRFGVGPILYPFNRKQISEIDGSRIILMCQAEGDVEEKYIELTTGMRIVKPGPQGVN